MPSILKDLDTHVLDQHHLQKRFQSMGRFMLCCFGACYIWFVFF